MACLAINSVSQPNGRLLGISYKHQAIHRASPILCAFDAINTLASWLLYVVSSQARFTIWNIRVAATRILLRRVVDTDGETDLGAIRTAVAQSRLRWVAFAIGVLPAVVKLYGGHGIPWSQAFGTMYLASWVIFDILLATARLDDLAFEEINIQPMAPPINPVLQICWVVIALTLHAALYGLPFAYFDDIGPTPLHPCLTSLNDLASSSFEGILAYSSLLLVAAAKITIPVILMVAGADSDSPIFEIIPLCAGTVITVVGVLCYRHRLGLAHAIRLVDVVLYPFFVYALLYDPAGTYQPL
ncbi:hypothetical protein BJX62DRAFT_243675 [Aspergillus germanicus]